jgi:hypothetical protein
LQEYEYLFSVALHLLKIIQQILYCTMEAVIKKLKFKSDTVVILNPPAELKTAFEKLQYHFQFDKKVKSYNTLAFVQDRVSLIAFLTKQLKHIEPDSVFWIAYPKGTSGIKTDIHRDIIWEVVSDYDLKTVAAISIDTIWSALRFRPIDMVGK